MGNKIEQIASDKQIKSSKQLKNKICADHPVITYESQSGGPWDARWLLWTSRGIFDESKELIEIQSVGKEITELKAAEEALKESEDRYRQLVDLAPVGIVLHSADRIAYINKAGTRFIGASSPDEILGKPILDFVHPDYRQIVIERVKRATEDGQACPHDRGEVPPPRWKSNRCRSGSFAFRSLKRRASSSGDLQGHFGAQKGRRGAPGERGTLPAHNGEHDRCDSPARCGSRTQNYIYVTINKNGWIRSPDLIGKSPFEVLSSQKIRRQSNRSW